MRRRLAISAALLALTTPVLAAAQDTAPPPPPAGGDALPADVHIDIATEPPEPKETGTSSSAGADALAEAPPPRPRRKGVVLESTLGALGFAGQFRHVAPPAYWLHAQLGFELIDWMMIFVEGELGLTDTGQSQDESHTKAFPIYGFGAGLRATFHASPRFAVFVQGDIDALAASVPHNALDILGYRNAESLAPAFGGRIGVDWYQIDRHLALTAQIGARDATGFGKKTGASASDTPILWDASLGMRYTF